MDLASQIRKMAASLKLTINEESMIFKFQRNILNMCID